MVIVMQLLHLFPAGETRVCPNGRECRARCLFQKVERNEEISNHKDKGIVCLVLSTTGGSEKHNKRL